MNERFVEIDAYPELALLCWNRADRSIAREDAFRLYEREWRLIDPQRMTPTERELLRSLVEEFGRGVIVA